MDIQFRQIQQRLAAAGISLEATDVVLDFLGEWGKDILAGRVSKDAVVEAVLEDGQVKFENVALPTV